MGNPRDQVSDVFFDAADFAELLAASVVSTDPRCKAAGVRYVLNSTRRSFRLNGTTEGSADVIATAINTLIDGNAPPGPDPVPEAPLVVVGEPVGP